MERSPSPRGRSDDRRRENRRKRDREPRDDRRGREQREERMERDIERRRPRKRSRSRSLDKRRRSPETRRTPSGPDQIQKVNRPSTSFIISKMTFSERPIVTPADLEGKTPEEQEMLKVMGFCGFSSTKGKKVDDNVDGEVHVVLKRKYRQYMHRRGGFNRPLDFVA